MTRSCSDRWVLCKTSRHSTMHLFSKYLWKKGELQSLKSDHCSVRVSYPCLNVCEQHTPPEEGTRASLSDYWWAVCLCSRPTDTSTLSLSHTQSLPQCRTQQDHQQPSLLSLSYGVSLFCALSGWRVTDVFILGVCKYIFFCAMIMWHIWSGTPFVKVHKHMCALGRLMKQACRAARRTCALHLPSNKNDSKSHRATITL